MAGLGVETENVRRYGYLPQMKRRDQMSVDDSQKQTNNNNNTKQSAGPFE